MSQVFQILHNHCHWLTPYSSVEETVGKYPPDCLFVEAPDYVNEQWGFDETLIGDERFIRPVPPSGFIYDDDSGKFIAESDLDNYINQMKDAKQAENNEALAHYLDNHPMTWIDGKQYGVTMEDQNEIAMNLLSYEMAIKSAAAISENGTTSSTVPILEWHARKEACVPWKYEQLVALSMAIREYVYPWYKHNQELKSAIYACTTIKEVTKFEIKYEDNSSNQEAESDA